MNNFITNNDIKDLKQRLIELIKKSDELKFLVGFFYFSGIRELFEGLKEKPSQNIKVLVGLNVDATNYGMIELADQDNQSIVRFNGSYMTGVSVIYINNEHKWETIYPGDTIMLQMSGITKEYYNFVNQVAQSGFNIPFFSGPPANVTGNISNGGIGFFAAYSNSFAKTVVR